MHVVITGGAGFIGTSLALRLLKNGRDVTIIDNLSPQIHGDLPRLTMDPAIRLIRTSITRLEPAEDALAQADVIVHLAAETGTGQSMYRICDYVEVNELGAATLLQTLARLPRKPRRILLASSRSVYGEGAYQRADGKGQLLQPAPRGIDRLQQAEWDFSDTDGVSLVPIATAEETAFAPASVYAATKAAQEMLLLSACEGIGATATILRLQNVYGEGQSLQNPYTGIISIFFNRARQGLPIDVYEDGAPTRDFVHIDDVVAAFCAAIKADLPHGLVMNVGSGIPTTILSLAQMLSDISGFDVPCTVSGKFRLGDIRNNWADISRAKQYIDYRPTVSLAQGLNRFVAWAQTQPTYPDRSSAAEGELRERGLAC